jgi:hypothetical protein
MSKVTDMPIDRYQYQLLLEGQPVLRPAGLNIALRPEGASVDESQFEEVLGFGDLMRQEMASGGRTGYFSGKTGRIYDIFLR